MCRRVAAVKTQHYLFLQPRISERRLQNAEGQFRWMTEIEGKSLRARVVRRISRLTLRPYQRLVTPQTQIYLFLQPWNNRKSKKILSDKSDRLYRNNDGSSREDSRISHLTYVAGVPIKAASRLHLRPMTISSNLT